MNNKLLAVFSILALTGLLMSCDDGVSSNNPNTDDDPTTSVVSGTFTYSPIIVSKGRTVSRLPQWSDAPSEQTVTYTTIPSLPDGMSIDETTGEITEGGTTVQLQPRTTYWVTATGTGGYEGSKTSTALVITGEFVFVDGGTFTMGSPEDEEDAEDSEKPQHPVTVSSFYMAKYEVTKDLYYYLMDARYNFTGERYVGRGGLPAQMLIWYDAVVFCNKLSEYDGFEQVYTITRDGDDKITDVKMDRTKNGYRLPTEAEWEYAARGGNKSKGFRFSGSDTADDVAWHSDGAGTAHHVGTKAPNELGLYDMSGNVWELCWDRPRSYSTDAQIDPTGATTGQRVIRGGAFNTREKALRVAYRQWTDPDNPIYEIAPPGPEGFRLVLSGL